MSLKGFNASVEEWGSKDCAALLDWLTDRFPGAERIVVGHSVGGFVTGFVTNGTLIDKMLLVSAHTGYWRDYAARRSVPNVLALARVNASDHACCWVLSRATIAPIGGST